jgi:hypothetical protein
MPCDPINYAATMGGASSSGFAFVMFCGVSSCSVMHAYIRRFKAQKFCSSSDTSTASLRCSV